MAENSNFAGTPQDLLFEAARVGDVGQFVWALQHGADLNAKTRLGYSVADLARNYFQEPVLALLKRAENADSLAETLDRLPTWGKGEEKGEGYGDPL